MSLQLPVTFGGDALACIQRHLSFVVSMAREPIVEHGIISCLANDTLINRQTTVFVRKRYCDAWCRQHIYLC
ncbi:MAG: hypothetical protein QG549_598 [Patescibacteria group bacterium]|jgi:hypothetical protein|nr:hypothetical protein [Patescibacteria group bacterium]